MATMITLYLIRHGQKRKDTRDPELTELGHQQAQKTAKYLQQFPISKVIASPRLRTLQTATHIATAFSLPVDHDPRLVERMDWGDVPDQSFTDFVNEWNEATEHRDFVPTSGVSSRSKGKNVQSVIDDLDEAQHTHVALVTHGGAIADFLRNIAEETQLQPLLDQFMFARDYSVMECSVTRICKKGPQYSLEELHSITHLK